MNPTGPRTEEGKANSSMNAIKHGCFAKSIVLPGESQEEFDALHYGFFRDYNPEGETESNLVRGLAEIQWRLNRLRRWEAAAMDDALETGNFESKALLNSSLIEQRLLRSFQVTLKLLKDTQAPRLAERDRQFRAACDIRQLTRSQELPWNPADEGFVFTVEQIDAAISRREWLESAARNVKHRFQEDITVDFPVDQAA